jgi:hypothetical protein
MNLELCNAGSIHDIPIGKGRRLNLGTDHFAIFRETFGHFYVFADDVPGNRWPYPPGSSMATRSS